jgi:uncharacterized membrane protein
MQNLVYIVVLLYHFAKFGCQNNFPQIKGDFKMQNQKSALGMDANVTALIGYLVGIVALILIFIEKDSKFVRFHSIQSVLWTAFCTIGLFVVGIAGAIISLIISQISGTLGGIVGLLVFLLYLALIVGLIGGLIYGAIKSYGGDMAKLPFVGNLADKWS